MNIELTKTEILLLQKALISAISKNEKNIKQDIRNGKPIEHWIEINNERRKLLEKLNKLHPLKY